MIRHLQVSLLCASFGVSSFLTGQDNPTATLIPAPAQNTEPRRPAPSPQLSRPAPTAQVSQEAPASQSSVPASTVRPVEPQINRPDEVLSELVLMEMAGSQVLDLLAEMTDKIILKRQDIQPNKITFDSRGPLTRREAVLALESLLTLNGIMLTDMGGRFMKAVPTTSVNTHVPQMLSGSTLELDPSQQIYAKLFKFDYLNAEQGAAPLVQNLVSTNSNVLIFPKSNALLITDALVNLQRIEQILVEADSPQSVREVIEFIKLDFVQASEMAERIDNLIQGPLKSYLEGNTSVTADERTNQLILITHPGNVDMIMQVVDSVDVDAAPLTASEVFPLKQAKAEEVVPIIDEIISGQKEGREEDAQVARENGGNNNGNNNGGNNNAPQPTTTVQGGSFSDSGSGSLQFSDFVGLSADERTNSIVAYGTQQDLKTLKDLIDKIDRPLPQVRIEAIITQVALRDDESRGINSFDLEYNLEDSNEINIGTGTAAGSSAVFSLKDFSLDLALETAESKSNIKILSTPVIVVSHNQEATINVSESRPIVTSSTSSLDSNNNTRSTVEYRDIGIQLTTTPLIGSDGTVQMEVEQLIEDVNGQIFIDGNPQPIITKREAKSYVSVSDGDVIVLGGLQENRKDLGSGSMELLGDLPLIGGLFTSKENLYQRIELIIFLQTTILTNPEDAALETDLEIDAAIETEALRNYIREKDLGDIYVEDSFIPAITETIEETEARENGEVIETDEKNDKPFIKINWPGR